MLLSQELKTSRFRDKFGVEGAVEAIHREKIGNCATSRHFHLCFFLGSMLAVLSGSMLQVAAGKQYKAACFGTFLGGWRI